jgi:serine/threonine protein kinase
MEASGSAPPDAFGPFRVLHQIGAGTLGPVFRADDSGRSRLAAVKVFQLDLPPERMHQLVAELEALVAAGLAHPAIVAPLATGTDGIVVYLAQEYVPAASLDVVMRDHAPASPGDALRVAVQLAGALDFAAAVNVHHGALHPRDVLISRDGARMTGLGVAGAIEQAGVTAPLRRPYSAPERTTGGPWDRRADVFSLAALAHEMLWGRRLTAVGAEAARALTVLPGGDLPALRAVFARALAAQPIDRFETALDFAAALQEALSGASSVAHESPPVERQADVELGLPFDAPPVRDDQESDGAASVEDGDALADLELRTVETVQSVDMADIPEPVPPVLPTPQPPEASRTRPPPSWLGDQGTDPGEPIGEPTLEAVVRSRWWPVAAALIAGVALGFGAGYTFAGRRAAPAGRPVAAAASGDARLPPDDSTRSGVVSPKPEAIVNASVAGRGRLVVRSTPAGALIFVDGREQGRTPATVVDLAIGAHRVRIAHAGYLDGDRQVVVTAARAAQSVTVELKRPAAAAATASTSVSAGAVTRGPFAGAALSVESRPAGSKVFIDGRLVGVTPMFLPQVGVGEHAIRLERDGYHRWSSTIHIAAGEPGRVTASLER